jgi:hypothetical protein
MSDRYCKENNTITHLSAEGSDEGEMVTVGLWLSMSCWVIKKHKCQDAGCRVTLQDVDAGWNRRLVT